jgi:hypothetical protein
MVDASHAGAAVGRILLEVGKALGKAVVAGIGLELARAASGHVKKAVGPKDKKSKRATGDDDALDGDDDGDRAATAADVARIRRENAALREELEALKRELRKVPADTVPGDVER